MKSKGGREYLGHYITIQAVTLASILYVSFPDRYIQCHVGGDGGMMFQDIVINIFGIENTSKMLERRHGPTIVMAAVQFNGWDSLQSRV